MSDRTFDFDVSILSNFKTPEYDTLMITEREDADCALLNYTGYGRPNPIKFNVFEGYNKYNYGLGYTSYRIFAFCHQDPDTGKTYLVVRHFDKNGNIEKTVMAESPRYRMMSFQGSYFIAMNYDTYDIEIGTLNTETAEVVLRGSIHNSHGYSSLDRFRTSYYYFIFGNYLYYVDSNSQITEVQNVSSSSTIANANKLIVFDSSSIKSYVLDGTVPADLENPNGTITFNSSSWYGMQISLDYYIDYVDTDTNGDFYIYRTHIYSDGSLSTPSQILKIKDSRFFRETAMNSVGRDAFFIPSGDISDLVGVNSDYYIYNVFNRYGVYLGEVFGGLTDNPGECATVRF